MRASLTVGRFLVTGQQADRDLLEHPAVAVRVAERGVGAIAGAVRIRSGHPALGPGAVEHPALVVEHLTDLHAAAGELGPGRLNVGDDEVKSLGGARCGGGEPRTEDNRARRAGRGHLDDPEVLTTRDVGVEPPPQALIETLGPVDIGDRHHNDLELHVHVRRLLLFGVLAVSGLGTGVCLVVRRDGQAGDARVGREAIVSRRRALPRPVTPAFRPSDWCRARPPAAVSAVGACLPTSPSASGPRHTAYHPVSAPPTTCPAMGVRRLVGRTISGRDLAPVPDAAFVVVTGVRIDAHMDIAPDSNAAMAPPQTASSSAGDQLVDPAVPAPALT